MLTLVIDTATSQQVVALIDHHGEVVQSADRPGARAQSVIGAIDDLVRLAGGPRVLGRVAVGVGPGGFTALRIGISTARGIAASLSLPIAAVPSLGAVAMEEMIAHDLPRDDGQVVAAIDAQRGELYKQQWGFTSAGKLMPLSGRTIVAASDTSGRSAGVVSARAIAAFITSSDLVFGPWADVVPDYGREADAIPTAQRLAAPSSGAGASPS
jgi:tRNA threonylcarbamoyl adenosine modification protein YeaZ